MLSCNNNKLIVPINQPSFTSLLGRHRHFPISIPALCRHIPTIGASPKVNTCEKHKSSRVYHQECIIKSGMSTSGMSTNAADKSTSSSYKFFTSSYPRSIEAAEEKLRRKLLSRDRGASFSSKSEMVEWIMNALHETGSVGGHRGTKLSKGTNVKGEQAYLYTSSGGTANKKWRHPDFVAYFLDLRTSISLGGPSLQGTCFAGLQFNHSATEPEVKKINEGRKAASALTGYMALAYYLNILKEKLMA